MDSSPSDTLDDVSALAWVQDELRKSLDTVNKALRRVLKEREAAASSDLDAIDAAPLRTARVQLHQSVGVMELVGLPAGAALLRGCETLVQRLIAKPQALDASAVEAVEKASFALQDFLGRRVAGKSVSPLALFPQYRAVQELAGADRVHPADLWPQDWQWQALAADVDVAPRAADAAFTRDFEAQVLLLMRNGGAAPMRTLSDMSAGLAAAEQALHGPGHTATLWQLAAAFFEAQQHGLLEPDIYTKRITSRLLAQLRGLHRGQPADTAATERLAQDLNFFCAQATPAAPGQAPRLAGAHRAYPPTRDTVATDYHRVQLGRHDPAAVTQARKRVATAKDAWSAVAGGETHRLQALSEQFSLMADSLKRLMPGGEGLGDALNRAAVQAVRLGAAPPPALAMEIATSVLYLEAALEEGSFDQPEQAAKVQRLAERIDAAMEGATPEPLEGWMEELYRRVSDRQTMGSVVQELRVALSEAEKLIDQFFRVPAEPGVLIPVPAQLQAMRGVLSVLGFDDATHAVVRMRDDVDLLVAAGDQALHQQPLFERLAGNLSALSFLIDLLGVQPQVAKTMFVFHPDTGLLQSVLGRRSTPLEVAAVSKLPAALIEQAQELAETVSRLDMPLADVSSELQRLADAPQVAAQPELAQTLSTAQAAFDRLDAPFDERETEARVRERVAEALADFVATGSDPVGLDAVEAGLLAPAPLAAPLQPAIAASGLEADLEMREVFLEEAQEVLATANEALQQLRDEPADLGALTTIRRAFHTLKGSSRMVGLSEFGEAGWACEQLYNAVLAAQLPATPELLQFTGEALSHLQAWVDAIAAGDAAAWHSQPLRDAADKLRTEGRFDGLAADVAVVPAATAIVADASAEHTAPVPDEAGASASDFPPLDLQLPDASDLELADVPSAEPLPAPPRAANDEPASALDFRFDLDGGLDLPPPSGHARESIDTSASEFAAFELGAAEPVAANDAMPLGEAVELVVDDGLPLDEDPPAPDSTDEAVITSLDLDVPALDDEGAEPPAAAMALGLPEPGWPEWLTPDALDLATAEPAAEPAPPTEPDAAHEVEPTAASFDAEPPTADPGHADDAPDVQAADAAAHADVLEADDAVTADASADRLPDDDQVRVIGPLRIGIPLFNIFLNEADELSRRLGTELSEWSHELERPVGETAVALAHSLAGSSAAVGFADLSALARQLEHTLVHAQAVGAGEPQDAQLFVEVSDELRRLLHQFAAGFLKSPPAELSERLTACAADLVSRLEAASAAGTAAQAVSESVHAQPDDGPSEDRDAAALAADLDMADGPSGDEPPASAPQVPLLAAEGAPADAAAVSDDPTADEPASTAPAPLLEIGQAGFSSVVPRLDEAQRAAGRSALDSDEDLDATDAIDPDLFPFFEEEAQDLLPDIASHLRDWTEQPDDPAHAAAAMRTLHTFKGGARLAGAMRLGELAHRLEAAIERQAAHAHPKKPELDLLLGRADGLSAAFEQLRQRDAQAYQQAADAAQAQAAEAAALAQAGTDAAAHPPSEVQASAAPDDSETEPASLREAPAVEVPDSDVDRADAVVTEIPDAIDWSRFPRLPQVAAQAADKTSTSAAAVRVRTQLLDRMVNQAGEVSIARARLESEVGQIKGSLGDLSDNLDRLRGQLRDIELQAETQMSTRMEAAKAASEAFDPLEFDRFTRFQELTRMMAESVNDVATVQRSLQRTLQTAEDELAAQARLTRELQDDLLRTRMVEFEGLSERLYRVVRQTAKETGKQVRLDIVGGAVEVDRGVLDRMTGAFEHLLRNCVTHGIEAPAQRQAAGKDAAGNIVVALRQEGNEVSVEFRDDGAGLDLPRIRAKGLALGLINADAEPTDADLANLIFTPGFSTADAVTELAGRGVGMDVVRAEVNALGGRIETASAPGEGTSFKLVLPLTTAVTQVVMLRSGNATVAVPATLVEMVRRATASEIDAAYDSAGYVYGEQTLPFFWLGALLQLSGRGGDASARTQPVVVVRSAQQRVALHVDEVLGNQEVVVKNLGPQLSRLPGLAGMTLLASGAVSLIYNPVALATVYGDAARQSMAAASMPASLPSGGVTVAAAPAANAAPMVLVVDDSLTVRRVTQRLLAREGYRVVLAKDGLEALARLAEERPAVLLSDIEMPRMDGFDLVRNVRADPNLNALPVIMITSRIAQKHRDYAAELGVNHYLGKPFSEEELLALIGRYCAEQTAVVQAPPM